MSDEVHYMLTTVDNPFSPFTHYDEWLAYDEMLGYFTNNLLARIARSSHDLSDLDYYQSIDEAIDKIVELNPSGVHRKLASNQDISELLES